MRDENPTPRFGIGSGPDEYMRHVHRVLRVARERAEAVRLEALELEKVIADGEILEVRLAGWRTTLVAPLDRARDIDGTFALRERARKAGLQP